MRAVDEAALECDFLEFYRILDYRELPARRAALFACGLPERSRIMMELAGSPVSMDTLLLATIADCLKILVWQQTEDGHKGRNQPKSILDTLTGRKTEEKGFDTAEEFEAWRRSMLGGED